MLQSERIKRAFLFDIKNILEKTNPKLFEKIQNTYIYGKRW